MFEAIISILLAIAALFVVTITLSVLFDFIEDIIREWNGTVVIEDVSDLISKVMQQEITGQQATSIEALKKKAGKKGKFAAAVKDGVVIKESVKLMSSDKQDEETENLMRENNGLLYVY